MWREFDQRLYELKLAERCHELHEKTQATRRRVCFEHGKTGQGEGVGLYAKLVDADLSVLREYLERVVDKVCREVWTAQGKAITPDFIRAVRDNAIFPTIAVRAGEIGASIKLMAGRTGFTNLPPVFHHLALGKGHLEGVMSIRYEIQARELELRGKISAGTVAEVSHISQRAPVGNKRIQRRTERAVCAADLWRDFYGKFMSLASEERAISRRESKDCVLRVYAQYNSDSTVQENELISQGRLCLLYRLESGTWDVSGGPNEDFKARFEALATRAGNELGGPRRTLPLHLWLHTLSLHLRRTDSKELFARSDTGGIITNACQVSATFCSRLEKQALETSASSPIRTTDRARAAITDPEVAKRRSIAKSNRYVSASEMCEIFDRERVPLPRRWSDAGFPSWTKAYRNSNYRRRIDTLISKDRGKS